MLTIRASQINCIIHYELESLTFCMWPGKQTFAKKLRRKIDNVGCDTTVINTFTKKTAIKTYVERIKANKIKIRDTFQTHL